MAHKVKSHLETEGYLTTKNRLIIEDAVYDNNNSAGSSGQVLSKDASGNVVWASSGGGGTIDGTGAANKIAFFTDTDTIDDTTLHWDSANGRLGIANTSPAYAVSINAATDFGGNVLHYNQTTKRVGIYTDSPSEKLDVNGDMRVRAAVKDGSNSAGTSGQVLTSTGTATSWSDAGTLAFRDVVTYSDTIKIGTSGTFYLKPMGEGDDFSINSLTTILTPYDGEVSKFIIRSTIAQTGFTLSLVDGSGTNIYTSGSINLVANTNYTLTPSSGSWTAGDRIALKMVRPVASNNAQIQVTAVYTYDI